MAGLKNMNGLAEVEYCLDRYLGGNIAGIMKETRAYLTTRQAEEYRDYQTSLGGILSSMASASNPAGCDNSMQILKATGEWNSKTTEDYIQMCRDKVLSDKELYHDLVALTMEWRAAIVAEIGQERYNQASKQIGTDLAAAYIDYRVQQTMIDRLIDEQTPKSTAEYIIRKAAEGSLIGLPHVMSRSPLEQQIAKEAEEKYKANGWEWASARAVSFAIDTVTTLGCGSWANLAKLAGVEVVFAGLETYAESKGDGKTVSIEECISKGVFGSEENVFDNVRGKAVYIDAPRNESITRINATLKRPVSTFSVGGYLSRGINAIFSPVADFIENARSSLEQAAAKTAFQSAGNTSETKRAEAELAARSGMNMDIQPMEQTTDNTSNTQPEDDEIRQEQEANQAGWGSLMSDLGFSGLGDIGKNLGYVIAMLPDILVGTMTGKTNSLHLRDNLIPMASIVAGMFIRNPLLKMVLIGMGGMNLLNKAGHESIGRHTNPEGLRFKRYDDEELNPRIASPVINGNCLVANIDRTPCSITLPDNVVAAYQSGALPLNTLANAVLARHEANSLLARENYRAAAEENLIQTNRQIR